MNTKNVKQNILKEVHQKIKKSKIKVAIISVISCTIIIISSYFFIFLRPKTLDYSNFQEISIEKSIQTINQISDEMLAYNHLKMITNVSILYTDLHFYIEDNQDNTTTLYFYISQSYKQKIEEEKAKNEMRFLLNQYNKEYTKETNQTSILLFPQLCKTDLETSLKDITKVYYLSYNYDNIKPKSFQKAKEKAILLWEES